MIREVRQEWEGAAHVECRCSSLRVRWWWMLTMNSHGVEISIAGCVEEMVRDPNPLPRGCPYIRVLPSTLTLHDSYSCVPRLMTHSESECEIHQLTRLSRLGPISQPIKTHKTSQCPKGVKCVNPMTHNYESCAKYINHMTRIVRHVKYQLMTINQ